MTANNLHEKQLIDRIADLEGALLAACNYMECAIPNLGRKASSNYQRAANSYRRVAAGTMKFSDIRDR